MKYSVSQINRDFLIVVTEFNEFGKRIRRTLVGVSTLLEMIGEELLNKFVGRAYKAMRDVCVCKLRRGLEVAFYVH